MSTFDPPTAADVQSYLDEGFVRWRGVYSSSELHVLDVEISRVAAEASSLPEGLVWFSPSRMGDTVIQRISRINVHSDVIQRWGDADERLLSLAGALLDTPRARFADGSEGSDGSVLVIKDPANASEHRSLRWHRDANFTAHLSINPFVNIGIYLDDAPQDAGNLVVLPRSHRLANFLETFEETTLRHPGERAVFADAGDVVAHDSRLWHCSRAHLIPGMIRRVLYFNYHAADAHQHQWIEGLSERAPL